MKHIEEPPGADARTPGSPGAKKTKSTPSTKAVAAEQPNTGPETAALETPKQAFQLPPIEELPKEPANETLNTAQFQPAGPGSMERIGSDRRSSEAAKYPSSQTIKKVGQGVLGTPSNGLFGTPVNTLNFQDQTNFSTFKHSRLNTESNRENLLLWDQKQLRQ